MKSSWLLSTCIMCLVITASQRCYCLPGSGLDSVGHGYDDFMDDDSSSPRGLMRLMSGFRDQEGYLDKFKTVQMMNNIRDQLELDRERQSDDMKLFNSNPKEYLLGVQRDRAERRCAGLYEKEKELRTLLREQQEYLKKELMFEHNSEPVPSDVMPSGKPRQRRVYKSNQRRESLDVRKKLEELRKSDLEEIGGIQAQLKGLGERRRDIETAAKDVKDLNLDERERLKKQLKEQRDDTKKTLVMIGAYRDTLLYEINPKTAWQRAIASGISGGKQNTISGAILDRAVRPLGEKVEGSTKLLFGQLFYYLEGLFGGLWSWIGLKSAVSSRDVDQIAEGVRALIESLKNARQMIDSSGAVGRTIKLRDMTRLLPGEDSTDSDDVVSDKHDKKSIRFILRENIVMQIDDLVKVVMNSMSQCSKGEDLARSCLVRIKHGLESIKELVSYTDKLDELVSTDTFPDLVVLSDFVKSACDSLKVQIDPLYDDDSYGGSSNKPYNNYYGSGGYGGAGSGYGSGGY